VTKEAGDIAKRAQRPRIRDDTKAMKDRLRIEKRESVQRHQRRE